MQRSDVFIYILAVLFGLSAGLLEITVGDLLATALAVLVSTLVLGFLRPRHAWRWILIVGPFVPLMRLAAYLAMNQKPYRAQIWESGLGFLTGIAGAYAGAMARMGVEELFLKP
jgi:O-antigen ligase